MKRLFMHLTAFALLLSANASVEKPVGSVAHAEGKQVIVKCRDANVPLNMNPLLHIVGSDSTVIALRVSYPVQAPSVRRAVSGGDSLIKPGMSVYEGEKPGERG